MKSNNTLKQGVVNNILRIVFVSFFVITMLMAGIWWLFKNEYQSKQTHLVQQEISSTISLYKSILSQKLSLVANSPVFIHYVNSGPLTRKYMYIKFLTRVSELNSPVITGMAIDSSQGEIFKSGKQSSFSVKLNLCYLNEELNYVYGDCDYTWKLYLDKPELIKQLTRINSHLTQCTSKSCKDIDMFQGKHFGIFTIADKTPIKTSLTIRQPESYLDVVFIVFVIMILLLGISLYFAINRIMRNKLTTPLNKIISFLEKGKLPETSLYIDELKFLCNQISEYYRQKDKIEIAKIAGQAAHDIRSPLAALEIVTKKLSHLPEQQRLLVRNATIQIRDIANNLLQYNVSREAVNYSEIKSVMLIPIIEYVLSEKNTELSEKNPAISLKSQITPEAYKAFIKVIPLELKRILSNLLNNAIEAIGESNGLIQVHVFCENDKVIIQISDNGPGIPNSLIRDLFREGVSTKVKGSGLGLFHAKSNIERWGGNIQIESEQNKGASITISLPKKPTANWFSLQLTVPEKTTIVVVDDSEPVFNLWQQRFVEEYLNIQIKYFNTPGDFLAWYEKHDAGLTRKYVYLIDYEFSGDQLNGIDLISKISPSSQKILVTSRSEDFDIQNRCSELNIKLIPKFYISNIPVVQVNTAVDAIFVEPESILWDAWQYRANKHNKQIMCYSSLDDFIADFRLFSSGIPIYVADTFLKDLHSLQSYKLNLIVISNSAGELKHHTKLKVTEKSSVNFISEKPNKG